MSAKAISRAPRSRSRSGSTIRARVESPNSHSIVGTRINPRPRRERLEIATNAWELYEREGGSREVELLLHRALLGDLIENGMPDAFDARLDDYERSAAELGSPRDIYWASALRATQMMMYGDLDAGEQLARGAELRGRELEQSSGGAFVLQRFIVRYQQARLAEEVAVLRAVADADSVFRAGASLLAVACAEVGQTKRAAAIANDDARAGRRRASARRVLARGAWRCSPASRPRPATSTCCISSASCSRRAPITSSCSASVVRCSGAVTSGSAWSTPPCGRLDEALEHFVGGEGDRRTLRRAVLDRRREGVGRGGLPRTGSGRRRRASIERLVREARALAERGGYGRVLAQADAIT